MGKTSYQNIAELVDEIQKNISRLNSGNLSVEEIEGLVDQTRELHERLIVLRFKAYENFAGKKEETTTEVEPESVEELPSFDLTAEAPPEKKEDRTEQEEQEQAPLFDLTEETPQPEEEEPTFDLTDDIVSNQNEAFAEAAVPEAVDKPIQPSVQDKATADNGELPLYQSLKDGDNSDSLRKKLQNQPINDIKTEISIARRFEYISCMFNGDGAAYESAIQVLNTCENAEDARNKLNSYSSQYDWDLENKAIIKFVELVERRYL